MFNESGVYPASINILHFTELLEKIVKVLCHQLCYDELQHVAEMFEFSEHWHWFLVSNWHQ